MPGDSEAIVLAAVAGAHGVTGEVRLKLFGEGLQALQTHASFNNGALTLSTLRSDNKGGAVARFVEIADRTAAEALRGTELEVPRDSLPALADGEFYHQDLIGLPVVTSNGETIGEVIGVENFGATDIVEIAPVEGRAFMVPLTLQAVPEWNDTRLVVNMDFLPE